MLSQLMAFIVWALLALSGTYWLLQLAVSPVPTPSQAVAAVDVMHGGGDLGRLLGAQVADAPAAAAAPQPADGRFKLLGLVAPKSRAPVHAREGVALLSIDGGPARSVRVGALVDGEWRLISLDSHSATLGGGGAELVLRLDPPPTATVAQATPNMAHSAAQQAQAGAAPPEPNAVPLRQ